MHRNFFAGYNLFFLRVAGYAVPTSAYELPTVVMFGCKVLLAASLPEPFERPKSLAAASSVALVSLAVLAVAPQSFSAAFAAILRVGSTWQRIWARH